MSKIISEQQIIEAATAILAKGHNLTLVAVRKHLGCRGSLSTIHKYLSKWKETCYKQAVNRTVNEKIDYNVEEKNRILKQNLNKQFAQNEHYAQELINAEKANIALKEENHQLQTANQELQLRLTSAGATNDALEKVTQKIQQELNLNTNNTIQKMQQTIDGLRLELKTLNEKSIAALRETSNQSHEALMQEKVTTINLQAKIDNLTKELLESKKQLNEAIMPAQVQIRSLSRHNEQLQKIIQEHGLDESPQLNEELNLQFTKGAAVYGK